MKKDTPNRLAESISLALNPILLLPVVFLIGLFFTSFPDKTSEMRWLGIILFSNFLIPIWLVFYLDQRGVVLDDSLENKFLFKKRLIALLPISIILLLEVIYMFLTHINEPLLAILLSSFFITLVGGLVSYYWKISAHAIGLSTFITILSLLIGPWALLGVIVIPFLAWARLILNRHTSLQLIAGTIIAPLIILTTFYLLGLK
jgi:membrane-associated phospholipid phosphatase